MSTKLTIFAQNIVARVCSLRFLGRFKTLTRCNRLPTSFKTALHRPTMLDLTVLDDAGPVWPGLNYCFLALKFCLVMGSTLETAATLVTLLQ